MGAPTPGGALNNLPTRLAGPLAFAAVLLAPLPDLSPPAHRTLAVLAWMVVWWITEAVPLAAASLLPLVLFPVLGVASAKEAAAPYANDLIFLFLGGFCLAAALQRWGSHERLAYALVARTGGRGPAVVLAVMAATAFVSMWISNTATAAMMYPIALALCARFDTGPGGDRTRTALMLGVAYAASIGGMATLVGTPPNLIFAAQAEALAGRRVGFGEFLAVGLPLTLVLLPACWALLVFGLFRAPAARLAPEALAAIQARRRALGRIEGGERRVLAVFGLTALAWLAREPKALGALRLPGLTDLAPGISDSAIAIGAAVVLFGLRGRDRSGRSRPLLAWEDAVRIPWDVLVLFGGGLSLAAALEATGLIAWLGARLHLLGGLPPLLVATALALAVLGLSELASNTAVAAMAMPLAASLAPATGEVPVRLMLVACFAASTGFALPVATPPNAIVFGSGHVTARQMLRAGLVLDLVAVTAIVAGLRLWGRVLE